jgi:F-type H+-transporting ATPase subunit epsilon|tara:strand:+ start:4195 stop:4608 length:414 start_codon:yes stop_codon:yes gene_type:complete
MPISLEIVTPTETVYSEEVDHVVVPTSSGKIDVLPNHVPVIDKLIAGDIKVEKDGTTEYLAVGSGFVEVYAEKVSLLTDQAINVKNTEESEIEEAIKRAEKALTDAKSSNIDQAKIDKLEAAARFAFAQKMAKGKSK